jgi:hypothetical protein
MALQLDPGSVAPSRRSILRFTVRALLIAIVVFGAVLGLRLQVTRRQDAAVRTIRALGGKVYYAYQTTRDSTGRTVYNPSAPTPYPDWCRVVGEQLFPPRVTCVGLRDTQADDSDLRLLADLPHVTSLDLTNTRITDRGLVHLSHLPLQSLSLTSTRVTDHGMILLRHLPLEALALWKTDIGDEGVHHLRGLTTLKNMVLDETRITDAAMEDVAQWVNMEEWLGLCHTRVTDDGARRLTTLKKLRNLNFIGTSVTEDCKRWLRAELPKADISVGDPPPTFLRPTRRRAN